MKFNKIIRQYNLIAVAIIVLIIGGVISAILNKGFRLSEYNDQIVARVVGNDSEKTMELLAEKNNVARVNTKTNEIYFYDLNKEEVKVYVNEIYQDNQLDSDIGVMEYVSSSSIEDLGIELAWSLGAVALITSIFAYIQIYKFGSRIKLEKILIHIAQFVLFFGLSLASLISVMFIFSNIYQIKKDEIIAVYAVAFFAAAIYAFGLISVNKTSVQNLKEINEKVFKTSASFGLNILRITALVLLIVSFGLGTLFVVNGALIVLGLILTLGSLIIVFKFNPKTLLQKPKFDLKKKKKEVKTIETKVKKSSKKVATKKKKSKKRKI